MASSAIGNQNLLFIFSPRIESLTKRE
jgi:hypothetical protein